MTALRRAQTLTGRITHAPAPWLLVALGLVGPATLSFLLSRPLPSALLAVPTQILALVILLATVRWNTPTPTNAWRMIALGFTLVHVVELSPRFIKLDIGLVHNVDRDPTRQAMIAGLAHFAGRAGSVVVAEGIEEPAELAMLRELGVPLGQGYLLGRPAPVATHIRDGAATPTRSPAVRAPRQPAGTRPARP